MNTNDLLLRWSHMTLDQIDAEIRAGKDQESTEQLLGKETVAELQLASFDVPSGDQVPVVLLPGIMGSLLSSIRGVTTLVWINPLVFLDGNARYLKLSDDWTQDGCPEVEMVPVGLEKMCYLKMELNLNRTTHLFEFPYDWRRPVEYNAGVLRNSLERWAAGSDTKFNLLAHSMGGLVARTYLALYPEDAEKRVRQLIMMGTPNFGATNAVETLLTGNSLMDTVDKLNQNNGMTEVVRGLPGVYNLLPAPEACFPTGKNYPVGWDLYDARTWKLDSIQQSLLDNTRALFAKLADSDPQLPLTQIAGCNLDTLVGIHLDANAPGGFAYQHNASGDNAGDGTVPLWSSVLPGANVFYVQEKHANLPGNNQVLSAVQSLLGGGKVSLPVKLPEPRSFLGLSFDVPEPVSPEVLKARIRSGTADQNDLQQLYFVQ